MGREREHPGQIDQLVRVVEATANSLAPEITLYGLAGPRTLEIRPQQFSRMLTTRLNVEQALALYCREENKDLGGWLFAGGLYRSYEDEWDDKVPIGEQPLLAAEVEIATNIDRLLSERTDDKPVVALDFGGGLGLSWIRIAAQPQYRAAIEEGRLVLIVTNLGSVPNQSPDSKGYSGIARSMNMTNELGPNSEFVTSYLNEDLRWTQNNQDYINYLDAYALDLATMSVDLPDGASMPLIGNVDIIHEHLALAHTHVPDLALASFNTLLSDRGTLYSDTATYYHPMQPEQFSAIRVENKRVVPITREYSYQRRLALAIGSKMLQLEGLSYRVDAARYLGIFSRLPNTEG